MKLIVPLPKDILVCCSGGVDSIAAAHWLMRKHNVTLFHFNHNTKDASRMEAGVVAFAEFYGLDIHVRRTDKTLTKEHQFRAERIKFLVENPFSAVTAHHISDLTEKYFLDFCTGSLRKIPMNIVSEIGLSKVYHPFLLSSKDQFIKYAERHNLGKFITEDLSNKDPKVGRRNWFRNELYPLFKERRIGLEKIVRKRVLAYLQSVSSS